MNKKLITKSFINTSLATLYIFLVSQIILNGQRWFGNMNNNFGPFVILLLFSLSAAVVGGLVFGNSVLLFFENKKHEGIKSAIYSIGWLGIYTFLGLLILLIVK